MQPFQPTALAVAVLLALSGGAALAQPANDLKALKNTVQELQQQLKELRSSNARPSTPSLEQARIEELSKQVNELRAQLAKQQAAAAAVAPEGAAGGEESEDAIAARTAATKADIQGLRTDLENYKYDQSRLQERNIPSVTRNTKIGGSLTVRYDYQDPGAQPSASASGNVPTHERRNGFSNSVVGLNFTGNLYRDYKEGRNLTYRAAFSTQNTASSSSNTLNLTDAYLRYSFQPASGNAEDPLGTVTVGQQTVPFGLDAQAIDPEVKSVIGNAGFVSGLGVGTRQVGVVVAGDYDPYVDFTNNYRAPLLSYALGVFNGNGPNRADNNSASDAVARLAFTLPVDYSSWFRQLQIGASAYLGKTSLASTGDTTFATATKKGNNDRYGVDVNWTHLPFSIAYEHAYGKKDLFTGTAANPDAVQRGRGQYLNFGYTWGEQFLNSSKQQGKFDDYWPQSYQAFIRLDAFDPNLSGAVVNDKQFTTTVGLNIFFAETTKFQINYLRTRNQLGGAVPTAGKPAHTDAIQAQFNASF